MKNIVKYILILIIFITIFIILKFYKSKKNIFEDIMIFSLWSNSGTQNEYEINLQNKLEIDVFSNIDKKLYKKLAPGTRGHFTIKFQRPENTSYKINIREKTSKPQNLVFYLENKLYSSIKEMENIINDKFKDTDTIYINWEWKYYIDEIHDIQDTKDGTIAQKYIFEIEAIIEQQERIEI